MLPLIPVLILLLLQGSMNVDSLTVDGRFPPCLTAHRDMSLQTEDVAQQVLALLGGDKKEQPAPVYADPVSVIAESPVLSEGFGEAVRSRDGPLA